MNRAYFSRKHIVIHRRRFDLVYHWPSRYLSVIFWRWRPSPDGQIYTRYIGFRIGR